MSSEDITSYHCSESHAAEMLDRLHICWKKRQLCDVELVSGVDNTRVPAHRIILSAASDVFSAMFIGSLRESYEREVVLSSLTGYSLQSMVDFCYTGCLQLKEDTVEELLTAANFLQIADALQACANFLAQQLDVANCVEISAYAERLNCTTLQSLADRFICTNFMEISKSPEFFNMSVPQLKALFASDDLCAETEEHVFRSLMVWIEHDYASRKQYMSELMEHIRLVMLPRPFLIDCVQPLCDSPQCQALFTEATIWHLLPERREKLNSLRTKPRTAFLNNLLVIGGKKNDDEFNYVEIYCPVKNKWRVWRNVFLNQTDYCAALLDNKLIIVGGKEGSNYTNNVKSLHLNTLEIESMSGMQKNRSRHAITVVNGSLYAVGGFSHEPGGGFGYLTITLDSVERWNPATREWVFVAPMKHAREHAGAAALHGHLYVLGGSNGPSLSSVECYDPKTKMWMMRAPMIKKRAAPGVAVANGRLYVMGGYDFRNVTDTMEQYIPEANSWTMICSLSSERSHISCALLGARILAIGGYNNQNQCVNYVECYDPVTNTWSSMAPLHCARAMTCVVTLPKTVQAGKL